MLNILFGSLKMDSLCFHLDKQFEIFHILESEIKIKSWDV